jgi:hypothetical protein
MRPTSMTIIALLAALAFALSAAAQDENSSGAQPSSGPVRAVSQGDKTIIFAPAGSRGLDSSRLQAWSEFADAHPKIATTLAYKPSLINDNHYLTKHPDLSAFFTAHPDIKDAMSENPGNFVAIPPRPGE